MASATFDDFVRQFLGRDEFDFGEWAMKEKMKALKPLKLVVRGPRFFDDLDLVVETLDKFTGRRPDVELVSDVRPEYQTGCADNSNFPIAHTWFERKWRWLAVRNDDKRPFSVTHYHFEDKVKKKDQQKAANRRRLEMIRGANAMLVFREVGDECPEVKEMLRLAKVYDLLTKVVNL